MDVCFSLSACTASRIASLCSLHIAQHENDFHSQRGSQPYTNIRRSHYKKDVLCLSFDFQSHTNIRTTHYKNDVCFSLFAGMALFIPSLSRTHTAQHENELYSQRGHQPCTNIRTTHYKKDVLGLLFDSQSHTNIRTEHYKKDVLCLVFDFQSHTNIRRSHYKKDVRFLLFICIPSHHKHINNNMSYWTKKHRKYFLPKRLGSQSQENQSVFLPHRLYSLSKLCQLPIYGI